MSKLLGGPESKAAKMAPQRMVRACRSCIFFYFGLRVPPRCTASLWVASLGTRIQCGGPLSPLPTGRDSLGIGGEVQWNCFTVLLGVGSAGRTVDSLLPSELAGGLYGCTEALRNKSRHGLYSVLGIWHDTSTLPACNCVTV